MRHRSWKKIHCELERR